MAATTNSSRSSSSPESISNPLPLREKNAGNSRNRSPSSPPPLPVPRSELPATAVTATAGPTNSHRPHHLSHPSVSSQRSGGLLAFFDRTIAGIGEPKVRPRQSLSRISTGLEQQLASGRSSPDRSLRGTRPASNYATAISSSPVDGRQSSPTLVPGTPPSQPYSETDPSHPEPTHVSRLDTNSNNNKMHQTSSRLLRMTDDDRPFTKVSCAFADLHHPFALVPASIVSAQVHHR